MMVTSLEKSFRLVDIGPNPENRVEVFFLLDYGTMNSYYCDLDTDMHY